MRTLTIKRNKKFAACLMTDKVYIEDNTNFDIKINNVPCRKLGKLKNGAEVTFDIENNQSRVFVIVDKLSKDYCNDFYEIPAGFDDVYLSGSHNINTAGNAFRFDNNNSEAATKNRKKSRKIGAIVFIAAFIIGIIVGFFANVFATSDSPKQFTNDGMSIVLTDSFSETDIDYYTVSYDSQKVAVFALKEEFSLMEGSEDFSVEDYGNLVLENNNLSDHQLIKDNEMTYLKYDAESETDDEVYVYYTYFYKTDNAFWLVQFATLKENDEKYQSDISEWAESVTFSNIA